MANPYGDIELDATGVRALAHPTRLAILDRLTEAGAMTATMLAPDVGASPSVTSWHLRHLAKHGLVRDSAVASSGRERWWEAASRGFRFAGSGEAARALARVMEEVEGDLVGQWRQEVEPQLEEGWQELAGRSKTRVLVTVEELARIESEIEALLAPYVHRKDDVATVPESARGVLLLRHTMPELAP